MDEVFEGHCFYPPFLILQFWVSLNPNSGELVRVERERKGKKRKQTRDNLCPDLEAAFLGTQNHPSRCFIHLAATQASLPDATHFPAKPPGPFSLLEEGQGQ